MAGGRCVAVVSALWVVFLACGGPNESVAQTSAAQSPQGAYSVVVAAAVDSPAADEALRKVQAAGYALFVKEASFGKRFNVHRPELDLAGAEALADEIRGITGFATVWETATLAEKAWSSRAAIAPCEQHGFPCTWDEVAPEIVKQTDLLGEIAVLHGISGVPLESVAAFLRDQPEVASAKVLDTGVQYRLKGGRPAWAFPRDELAHHRHQDDEQSDNTSDAWSPRPLPSIAFGEQEGSPLHDFLGTLGAGLAPSRAFAAGPREKQGVAAEEPGQGKKALILTPFEYEFPGWGETFASRVSVIRDYKKRHDGEVVLRANLSEFEDNPPDIGDKLVDGTRLPQGEVRFQDFLGWDEKDYSLIIIASHGTYHDCHAPTPVGGEEGATVERGSVKPEHRCPLIWAGRARQESYGSYRGVEVLTYKSKQYETHPGLTRREAEFCAQRIKKIKEEATEVDEQAELDKLKTEGGKPCRIKAGDKEKRLVGLWTPFFREQYPNGLENVIMFLGACRSGTNDILLDHFAQKGNEHVAVIGFDDVVSSYDAFDLASDMLDILLDAEKGGFHTKELIKELKKKDRTKHMVGSALAPGDESLPDQPADIVDTSAGPTHARDVVMLLDPDSEEELEDGDTVTVVGVPGDGAEDKLELLPQIIGVAESDPLEEIRLSVYPADEQRSSRRYEPDRRVRRGVHRYEDDVFLGRDYSFEERVDLEVRADLPGGGESLWRYDNMLLVGPHWRLSISGGPAAGQYRGADVRPSFLDGRLGGVGLHIEDSPLCPMVAIRLREPITGGGTVSAEASVAFLQCEGAFGNMFKGTPYEIANAGRGGELPVPPATLVIREISDELVTGSLKGEFFQTADGDERIRHDVRANVSLEFVARLSELK